MQHQIIFYKTAFIYQRELEGLRKKKEKKENNHSPRGQTTLGLKQFGHFGLNLILLKRNSNRWII